MGKRGVAIIVCCLFLISCSPRVSLEKVSLILLIALDKTTDGDMLVGTSLPLFHHEKQENTIEHLVKASSVYNGFSKINTKLTGFLTSAKTEIILLGKKFAQEENWIKQLDSSYRDPYSTINAKLILVDGSIEEIFNIKRPDKPRLPTYIKSILESSFQNNQSVPSTIQQLIREKNEQGMTQTLPIIKRIGNEIDTTGIGFMNYEGRYVTMLPKKEVVYFNLLNKSINNGRMVLHLPFKATKKNKQGNTSIFVQDAKRTVKVKYKNGKFLFNIDIYIEGSLIEKTNGQMIKNITKEKQAVVKLEHNIKRQLDEKLESILKQIQKYEIDPLGLVLYARAYEYEEWKKIKNNWPDVFSKAKLNIDTHIKINNTGTTRG
ncbi:Ger(x)C family spore germination protein [Bacillus bombysepticus]